MTESHDESYEQKFRLMGKRTHAGEMHTRDCKLITELVWTFRDEYPEYSMNRPDEHDGRKGRQRRQTTLAGWVMRLSLMATVDELHALDEKGVNQLFGKILRGEDRKSKAGSRTKGTVALYQAAARQFYRVHDQLGVDPDNLILYDTSSGSDQVRPEDMLTREEILECDRVAARHDRDYAIWNVLLYTGMRNTCLRTLRWKDVNLEEGVWRPNQTIEEGLKHFYNPHEWRPLLGAKGPLLSWRKEHVDPSPEAFIFTNKPKYAKVHPYDPVKPRTISRVTNGIKKEAGIEKPLHPHMLRHNFVTICKLEKELTDDTVKWLIGHRPESDVMNTTYSHISGDDHVEKAKVAFGYLEEEDTSQRLTPDVCKACEQHLDPEFNICPHCGTPYDHEIAERQRNADEAIHETKGDTARSGDEEGEEAIDELKRLLDDNPELKKTLGMD